MADLCFHSLDKFGFNLLRPELTSEITYFRVSEARLQQPLVIDALVINCSTETDKDI